MNKVSILMLSAFLCASSLCGCAGSPKTAESSVVSQMTEVSVVPEESADPDIKWYIPSGTSDEMKNELKGILTSGGWQFLDGTMHGTEIAEADKGVIRNSSIWFNDNDTAVYTFDGKEYNATYEISQQADVALHFTESEPGDDLRPYLTTGEAELTFHFFNDEKYGMLLVDEHHPNSVKYFKTMI